MPDAAFVVEFFLLFAAVEYKKLYNRCWAVKCKSVRRWLNSLHLLVILLLKLLCLLGIWRLKDMAGEQLCRRVFLGICLVHVTAASSPVAQDALVNNTTLNITGPDMHVPANDDGYVARLLIGVQFRIRKTFSSNKTIWREFFRQSWHCFAMKKNSPNLDWKRSWSWATKLDISILPPSFSIKMWRTYLVLQ